VEVVLAVDKPRDCVGDEVRLHHLKLIQGVFLPERHDGVVKAVVDPAVFLRLHDLAKLVELGFLRGDFVKQVSVAHQLADFEELLVFKVEIHFTSQVVHFLIVPFYF